MPTYEYKCDACGHSFERFQPMSSSPVRKCPKCGKLKVRRLIGAGAGLIFKGGGFYITDYRSDAYKESAKSDQAPAAATPATDAKKPADSKPAETKAAPAAESAAAPAPKPKSKPTKDKS
jgi:putative FmdB family regulatory protein